MTSSNDTSTASTDLPNGNIQRYILEDVSIFQAIAISTLVLDYLKRQEDGGEVAAKCMFNAWIDAVNKHANRYLSKESLTGNDAQRLRSELESAIQSVQPEIANMLQLRPIKDS